MINGLEDFLRQSQNAGIKMAIGSAAIRSNIDFVLDGMGIRHYFDAIVSADDVNHSKPDPETYFKCADKLDIDPRECLVFEDAPKGAESAQHANMDCVILTTLHEPSDFGHCNNIISYIEDYNNFRLT